MDFMGFSSYFIVHLLTSCGFLGVFPIFLMLGQQMVTSDEASEEVWALADILYHICAFFDPQDTPRDPTAARFGAPCRRFWLQTAAKSMLLGPKAGHVSVGRVRPLVGRPRERCAMRGVRRATIWSFNVRTELVEEEERPFFLAPEAFEAKK